IDGGQPFGTAMRHEKALPPVASQPCFVNFLLNLHCLSCNIFGNTFCLADNPPLKFPPAGFSVGGQSGRYKQIQGVFMQKKIMVLALISAFAAPTAFADTEKAELEKLRAMRSEERRVGKEC